MSKQYPAQFGNSDMYRNPNGTLPMPSPADIPRPQWYSANLPWSWRYLGPTSEEGVGPTGFIYSYTWTSPTFDLRPDLRSGQGGPKAGVPIWSAAARLYVQLLSNANASGEQPVLALPNVNATVVDYVSTTFNFSDTQGRPGEGVDSGWGVQPVSRYGATAEFTPSAGNSSVLVGFAPPGTSLGFGDGYPIRYWRTEVIVTVIVPSPLPLPDPPLDPPRVVMQASVY